MCRYASQATQKCNGFFVMFCCCLIFLLLLLLFFCLGGGGGLGGCWYSVNRFPKDRRFKHTDRVPRHRRSCCSGGLWWRGRGACPGSTPAPLPRCGRWSTCTPSSPLPTRIRRSERPLCRTPVGPAAKYTTLYRGKNGNITPLVFTNKRPRRPHLCTWVPLFGMKHVLMMMFSTCLLSSFVKFPFNFREEIENVSAN